jgi:hypothetical protein
MQAISHQRQIMYLLLLGFVPLFFIVGYFFSKSAEQTAVGFDLDYAISQAAHKATKEYQNKIVKQKFQDGDHFYIDKEIETIALLSNEIEEIKLMLKQGFHQQEEALNKRLQFLTNGQNRITFVEGTIKPYATFQETIETLAHSVEVDISDLKHILAKIEGITSETDNPARPHLIITECKIERKKGTIREIFSLDLKVLKREYLK